MNRLLRRLLVAMVVVTAMAFSGGSILAEGGGACGQFYAICVGCDEGKEECTCLGVELECYDVGGQWQSCCKYDCPEATIYCTIQVVE